MSIDITQQALNALADAGLGNDSPAEAYEQGKQAVFDAMNHFDELAIVERANPYRKDGR